MAGSHVNANLPAIPNDRKPRDTAFYQQNLRHINAHLTPLRIILIYTAAIAITIPIGVTVLKAAHSVNEISMRYDLFPCLNSTMPPRLSSTIRPHFGLLCYSNFSLVVPLDMSGPLYFYYQLTNYYQNHRRYVESRSYDQIRGAYPYTDSTCDPLTEYSGTPLLPCGLTANSFFNDTFAVELCTAGSCRFLDPDTEFMKSGIAYSVDNGQLFTNFTAQYSTTNWGPQGFELPSTADEDLMVWMRVASLPSFYKLHRILPMDLHAGDSLNIHVNNVYAVDSFSSEKHIIIANASWMGGRNVFLGWAYILLGCFCSFAYLLYLLKRTIRPRKLGDLSYFAHKSKYSIQITPESVVIERHAEIHSPQQPYPLQPYRPHNGARTVIRVHHVA